MQIGNSADINNLPTTTTLPARIMMFQPTQRPIHVKNDDWIETSWGKCKVKGRLGQRHADVLEAAMHFHEKADRTPDGRIVLLVDPAVIRKTLSERRYSLDQIRVLLDELSAAIVRIVTRNGDEITGHIIDTYVVAKKKRYNPLTRKDDRSAWVVTLGDAFCEILKRDVHLHYDPTPIARLSCGISQAVARHLKTHSAQPNGGWVAENLIRLCCKGSTMTSQFIRNKKRELKSEIKAFQEMGIIFDGERFTLAGQENS